MAAQTELTPERFAKAVDLARKGNFATTIATLIGVHRHTIANWLKFGDEQPGSEFERFAIAFREAEAEFERESLALIASDPKGHRGLMWILEKRHGDRFGNRVKTEVTGKDGEAVQVATTAKVVVMPPLVDNGDLGDDLAVSGRDGVPTDRTPSDVPGKPR